MAVKAKESAQVQKARRKLKKQLGGENKRVNKKALEQIRETMKRWIRRHDGERINLMNKTFTLFDENKHTERSHDRHIQALMQRLQKGLSVSIK